MAGAPVGRELERYSFRQVFEAGGHDDADDGQGSIMMVVATDAPLSPFKLEPSLPTYVRHGARKELE